MPIATVRIAPMERWCEKARAFAEENPQMKRRAGQMVNIIMESCRPNQSGCSAKHEWQVPDDEAAEHFEQMGIEYNPAGKTWICESMLEMD